MLSYLQKIKHYSDVTHNETDILIYLKSSKRTTAKEKKQVEKKFMVSQTNSKGKIQKDCD